VKAPSSASTSGTTSSQAIQELEKQNESLRSNLDKKNEAINNYERKIAVHIFFGFFGFFWIFSEFFQIFKYPFWLLCLFSGLKFRIFFEMWTLKVQKILGFSILAIFKKLSSK
jgi:hypothetical protein